MTTAAAGRGCGYMVQRDFRAGFALHLLDSCGMILACYGIELGLGGPKSDAPRPVILAVKLGARLSGALALSPPVWSKPRGRVVFRLSILLATARFAG